MKHPIPDAALDDRLGFVGTAGSGKTYNAGGCIERLLDKGARVVIVDPLDVWWGLRLVADGQSPSRYSMPIFGGAHGDLPLNEHAGALIGETVAGMAESCIISLGGLQTKASERRFMLAFLDAIYRKANGEPVHIIFDEADLWAPQKSSEPMLQSRMEEICRRGRIKGLIPWLITQRPAVISKDVLSQVDGLIAFKLTSSQDRDALEGWIEGQADRAEWKIIRAQLPTMERGHGIVWIPARGILGTASFPEKRTFDSSRTPKRGEKQRRANLQPLDLGKLKERLATVEAAVHADDPKKLRSEIAELKFQLAKATTARPPVAELVEAECRGYKRGLQFGRRLIVDLVKMATNFDLAVHAKKLSDAIDLAETNIELEEVNKCESGLPSVVNSTVDTPKRASSSVTAVVRRPSPVPAGGDGAISGSERRIIDAIRWWNVFGIAAPSHAQVGFIAGFSHKSGTWATYLSRLRSKGLIEGRGDLVLTDIGLASAAEPATPPTVEALHAAVLDKIDAPLRKILQPLLEVYPDGLTHEEAGQRAGYSYSSGTWATYLSRLRSLDLISRRGELKAEAWLFAR